LISHTLTPPSLRSPRLVSWFLYTGLHFQFWFLRLLHSFLTFVAFTTALHTRSPHHVYLTHATSTHAHNHRTTLCALVHCTATPSAYHSRRAVCHTSLPALQFCRCLSRSLHATFSGWVLLTTLPTPAPHLWFRTFTVHGLPHRHLPPLPAPLTPRYLTACHLPLWVHCTVLHSTPLGSPARSSPAWFAHLGFCAHTCTLPPHCHTLSASPRCISWFTSLHCTWVRFLHAFGLHIVFAPLWVPHAD